MSKLVNPRRLINLVGSLLVAFGPALAMQENWDAFVTPRGIGESLGIVGGVLMAWLSRSPRDDG